ncbi:MAG: TrmJ/YjtD family RNA methyltransferase [Ketobacteraceae bacterium]|nr:TrmJ/YjtD family RNA methyltransferase [Ketobacteraceae bacterium]
MLSPGNIRIVMMNTSDSGNIGAAARAIKTMGFSRLYLVEPKDYPSGKATARASGAADVLHRAVVTSTLDEALEGANLVVGTSARMRSIPWPVMTPREFAAMLQSERDDSQVAIVFGREDSGLTNDELRRCHYHVSIPGNPDYGVLNVAAAIQLICYDLRMTLIEAEKAGDTTEKPQMILSRTEWDAPLVSSGDMERFFQHLEQTLLDIRFYDPNNPRQILTRIRRLFSRTRLDQLEMNLMRGILARVQQVVNGKAPVNQSPAGHQSDRQVGQDSQS